MTLTATAISKKNNIQTRTNLLAHFNHAIHIYRGMILTI